MKQSQLEFLKEQWRRAMAELGNPPRLADYKRLRKHIITLNDLIKECKNESNLKK